METTYVYDVEVVYRRQDDSRNWWWYWKVTKYADGSPVASNLKVDHGRTEWRWTARLKAWLAMQTDQRHLKRQGNPVHYLTRKG